MVTRLSTYLDRFALLSPANLASNVASQRTVRGLIGDANLHKRSQEL